MCILYESNEKYINNERVFHSVASRVRNKLLMFVTNGKKLALMR